MSTRWTISKGIAPASRVSSFCPRVQRQLEEESDHVRRDQQERQRRKSGARIVVTERKEHAVSEFDTISSGREP